MFHGLAQQTIDSIAVRLAGVALVVENDRYALVGRLEYRLGFWDHTQQRNCQDLFNVFYAQHLALAYALRVVAGQQQMLLDRVFAFLGATGFAGRQPDP